MLSKNIRAPTAILPVSPGLVTFILMRAGLPTFNVPEAFDIPALLANKMDFAVIFLLEATPPEIVSTIEFPVLKVGMLKVNPTFCGTLNLAVPAAWPLMVTPLLIVPVPPGCIVYVPLPLMAKLLKSRENEKLGVMDNGLATFALTFITSLAVACAPAS